MNRAPSAFRIYRSAGHSRTPARGSCFDPHVPMSPRDIMEASEFVRTRTRTPLRLARQGVGAALPGHEVGDAQVDSSVA